MLVFEKCHSSWSSVPCQPERQIEDWIIFKYVVVLSNRRKFIQHRFGGARMENSLKLEWYPLSARIRADYVNEIVRQSSDLNDDYLSMGTFTL